MRARWLLPSASDPAGWRHDQLAFDELTDTTPPRIWKAGPLNLASTSIRPIGVTMVTWAVNRMDFEVNAGFHSARDERKACPRRYRNLAPFRIRIGRSLMNPQRRN